MTTRQKQLIENYIRLKVKKMMNEKRALKEAPETNLEQYFSRWLLSTAKQVKIAPKEYASGIFNYLKKEFNFK